MDEKDSNRVEIAKKYLSNESTALKDWYREYRSIQTGVPGGEISVVNIPKIQESFDEWFDTTKEDLYRIICVEWNYPEKRKRDEYKETVLYVIALADFLIAKQTNVPSPLALASLLVMKGLDNFCASGGVKTSVS